MIKNSREDRTNYMVTWLLDDEYGIQIDEFIQKYNPLFGVNLTWALFVEMAVYCFMEDVKNGKMDIIGLADCFDFSKEQLKITPNEDELNKKLEEINKG